MKKLVLIAAVMLLGMGTAYAGVTCNTYGNQTYCSGYDSNGNYYSYTCNTYGNQTTCN